MCCGSVCSPPVCVQESSGPRWAAGRGGVELVQQLLKAKARSELMANRGSAVKLGVSGGRKGPRFLFGMFSV